MAWRRAGSARRSIRPGYGPGAGAVDDGTNGTGGAGPNARCHHSGGFSPPAAVYARHDAASLASRARESVRERRVGTAGLFVLREVLALPTLARGSGRVAAPTGRVARRRARYTGGAGGAAGA